MTDISFLGYSF